MSQSPSHRGNIKEAVFPQSRSRWTICPAQVDYISQWPTKDQITDLPVCLAELNNSRLLGDLGPRRATIRLTTTIIDID